MEDIKESDAEVPKTIAEWVSINGIVYNINTLVTAHNLLYTLSSLERLFTGNVLAKLIIDANGIRIYSVERVDNKIVSDCSESCSSAFVTIPEERSKDKPSYVG